MRCGTGAHLVDRARGDDLPTFVAAFRPQVDEPVGLGHDVEIMLDHQHRVACVGEPVQHLDELLHIRHVQPHGRLVEHIGCAFRV